MSMRMSIEEIRHIAGLAELELKEEEAVQAGRDMEEMLLFMEKLKELETGGVDAMSHISPSTNVFREDVVTNEEGSFDLLKNAPAHRSGAVKVPRIIV